MAYKWTCEYCGKSAYSANPDRELVAIPCDTCGKLIDNPYYEGVRKP